MAIDPVALRAEIDTDPESLISTELKSAGATRAMAQALNAPRSNADPANLDPTTQLPVEFNVADTITGGELLSAIDIDEFSVPSFNAKAEKLLIAAIQQQTIPVTVNLITLVRQNFPDGGPTRNALSALIYTPKSRAELLWGQSVTQADVRAALAV